VLAPLLLPQNDRQQSQLGSAPTLCVDTTAVRVVVSENLYMCRQVRPEAEELITSPALCDDL